jgi:hypothetical protein
MQENKPCRVVVVEMRRRCKNRSGKFFDNSISRKIFIRALLKLSTIIGASCFGSQSRDSPQRARCKMRLFISPETSERSNFPHLKGRHMSINILNKVAILCSKFGSTFLQEKISSNRSEHPVYTMR